jgi:hypothetical protein
MKSCNHRNLLFADVLSNKFLQFLYKKVLTRAESSIVSEREQQVRILLAPLKPYEHDTHYTLRWPQSRRIVYRLAFALRSGRAFSASLRCALAHKKRASYVRLPFETVQRLRFNRDYEKLRVKKTVASYAKRLTICCKSSRSTY